MSSKRIFGTTVVRAIEDEKLPETMKKIIIQSIFDFNNKYKNSSASNAILNGIMNSGAMNFSKAYNWARDNYYYGLPNGNVFLDNPAYADVKAIIESAIGHSIEMSYYRLAPLNHTHYGWHVAVESLGYNEESNELSTLSSQIGHSVYLSQIVPLITEELLASEPLVKFSVWGRESDTGYTPTAPTSPSRPSLRRRFGTAGTHAGGVNDEPRGIYYETITGSIERVAIEYTYVNNLGESVVDRLVYALPEPDPEWLYYQAKYYYTVDEVTYAGYWTYKYGAGTYPILDSQRTHIKNDETSFFPFVVFRDNKQNLSENPYKVEEIYESSVRLMKKMGMDYQEISDAIHDPANPDIADVQQAILTLAVPAKSNDPLDAEYLFDFFNKLYLQTVSSGYVKPLGVLQTDNYHRYTVSDGGFSMELKYGDLTKTIKPEIIGIKGAYQVSQGSIRRQKVVTKRGTRGSWITSIDWVDIGYIEYKKQVTSKVIEVIRVLDPQTYYPIWSEYGYVANTESDEIMIPLDMEIAQSYQTFKREKLFYRSLHYIFNSYKRIKLQWYETGVFKFFITAVAVIVTFISFGSGSPLVAAISAGSSAVALYILEMLVVSIIISASVKAAINEFGLEETFIAALLLLMASYFSGKADLSLLKSTTLMQVSTNIYLSVTDQINTEIKKIFGEISALTAEYGELFEELEEARKLLDTKGIISPEDIIRVTPMFIPGESPSSFFERTIHTGNPGVLSFNVIEKYVDLSLTLPDINQSLR